MKSGDKLTHPEKGSVVYVAAFGDDLAEVRTASGVIAVVTASLLSLPAKDKPKQAAE